MSALYPIVLGLLAGVPGAVIGFFAMVLAGFFGGPFGFGVAQMGLLVSGAGNGILVAEAVFIGVLLAEVSLQFRLDIEGLARVGVGSIGIGLVAFGIEILADFTNVVTLILVSAGFTIGIYLLHRYEVVMITGQTESLE